MTRNYFFPLQIKGAKSVTHNHFTWESGVGRATMESFQIHRRVIADRRGCIESFINIRDEAIRTVVEQASDQPALATNGRIHSTHPPFATHQLHPTRTLTRWTTSPKTIASAAPSIPTPAKKPSNASSNSTTSSTQRRKQNVCTEGSRGMTIWRQVNRSHNNNFFKTQLIPEVYGNVGSNQTAVLSR